jgi:hypothetical protein
LGKIIVQGGNGNDSLNLDDSGDNKNNESIIDAFHDTGLAIRGKVSGLGLTGGLEYLGIETFKLFLCNGGYYGRFYHKPIILSIEERTLSMKRQ